MIVQESLCIIAYIIWFINGMFINLLNSKRKKKKKKGIESRIVYSTSFSCFSSLLGENKPKKEQMKPKLKLYQ